MPYRHLSVHFLSYYVFVSSVVFVKEFYSNIGEESKKNT